MNKLVLLGVASGLALMAAQANALTLTLTQGASTVTVVDEGAGDLLTGTANAVAFAGSVGTYNINVSTTAAFPATALPVLLDLNSINIGVGELIITASQTFNAPVPLSSLLASIGGTTTGTEVDYDVYLNTGSGDVLITSLLFTTSPFAGEDSALLAAEILAGPYTITQVVTIDHNNAGDTTSFDADVRQVSEPATLGLLGMGLLGLGALRRRKAA